MENLQEKLNRLAKESEREMREMGFSHQLGYKRRTYNISPKANHRLGVCKHKKNIEVSRYVLERGTDTQIKNVIIHEIIHTFDDCKGHQRLWQSYAREVNRHGVYHITTTQDLEVWFRENGTDRQTQKEILNERYKITCLDCGHVWYQSKMLKRTLEYYKEHTMYHSKDKSHRLRVEDLKEHKVLVSGEIDDNEIRE